MVHFGGSLRFMEVSKCGCDDSGTPTLDQILTGGCRMKNLSERLAYADVSRVANRVTGDQLLLVLSLSTFPRITHGYPDLSVQPNFLYVFCVSTLRTLQLLAVQFRLSTICCWGRGAEKKPKSRKEPCRTAAFQTPLSQNNVPHFQNDHTQSSI